MIVVTCELWRRGNPNDRETLGVGVIYNDATGDHTSGNYRFLLSKKGVNADHFAKSVSAGAEPGGLWKSGEVKGFPRMRLLAWDLLGRVLEKVAR